MCLRKRAATGLDRSVGFTQSRNFRHNEIYTFKRKSCQDPVAKAVDAAFAEHEFFSSRVSGIR